MLRAILWDGFTRNEFDDGAEFSPWYRVARILALAVATFVALIVYNAIQNNSLLSIDDILNNKTAAIAIGSSVAFVGSWQLQGLLRDLIGIPKKFAYTLRDSSNDPSEAQLPRFHQNAIMLTTWTGQGGWRVARLCALAVLGIFILMIAGGKMHDLSILGKSDLAVYLTSFIASGVTGWQLNGLYIEKLQRGLYRRIHDFRSAFPPRRFYAPMSASQP